MSNAIRTLVQDYGWIHTGLGLFGNTAFFVGSILFLPAFKSWAAVGVEWQTIGVYLFIGGALFMWIGSCGSLLVKIFEAHEEDRSR